MRTAAYCMLHYGAEYFSEALQAVDGVVDKIIILYSNRPTHGSATKLICPDSRQALVKIANDTIKTSAWEWEDIQYASNEGQHREMAFNHCRGFDVLVNFDSDEVWDREGLKSAIEQASKIDSKYIQLRHDSWVNFWRSFDYIVKDGFCPVRLHNLKSTNREQGMVTGKLYHFGCAQSEDVMRYKYEVHGHKSEIRPNWLNRTYYGWTPENNFGDLHPVAIGLWNAEPFDKNTLPESLKNHPNFNKRLI
jgi:hypothetical protein